MNCPLSQVVPLSYNASYCNSGPEIPKCLGQYNRIPAKPKLVFRFNKSALEDSKFKEPEEIGPAKPVSYSNGADPLICSSTKAPWYHIHLSFGGPMQGMSYTGGFRFKVLKGHTAIKLFHFQHLLQILATHWISKITASKNVTWLPSTHFEVFCHSPNISSFHSLPNLNSLDDQLASDASCWCPSPGVNCKDLYSQYVILTLKLNTCYSTPQWHPEIPEKQHIIDPIVYAEASEDLGRDSS
ncbi:unnamed protein product [Hymenolepis diminuta]|uniref:Uncharacterized protein n=1 Tax=Hymenolepis diminuta TaxID=6216 RepID=A0A564YT36_HYMDI|nr:unnamed protein product [Hymenolepis diminuta]